MEQEKKILTREELKLPKWKKMAEHSMELAYAKETDESARIAEAQEVLLNFISDIGGIRSDVYEYLMIPRLQNAVEVTYISSLLCYAAPLEWIRFSLEALERNQICGAFYVNEITEAYKAGIPVEAIGRMLQKAETVIEFGQNMAELKTSGSVTEKSSREDCGRTPAYSSSTADREYLKEDRTDIREEELARIVSGAVLDAMREFAGSGKNAVTTDSKGELPVKGEREKAPVSGNGNRYTQEKPNPKPSQKKYQESFEDAKTEEREGELVTEKERECGEEEKNSGVPEFPDGKESLDKRMLVTDLEQARMAQGERVSFFQILLSRHMKKIFEKMDKEAQVGKIFELMVEKKYRKEKILAIRRLMEGGMTNEFIFSLLEKDLPEEELKELCDTLVTEMPVETGKAENVMPENEESFEEDFAEGEEEE